MNSSHHNALSDDSVCAELFLIFTIVKTKLYLDDFRLVPNGFVLVKNYKAFTDFIQQNGLPDFISFDHDLGEEKSGYDCAKWLVEFCLDNNMSLPEFAVHSQNPVGKENIESLLGNFKKVKENIL